MKPMAAAAVGALISGLAMYAVTTRAMQTDPFANVPALVQTVDGRYVRVPNAETVPYGYVNGFQSTAQPVVVQPRPATVYRTAQPQRVVETTPVVERRAPRRSWAKTGMIIGGSTAGGAGLGGLIGGKKGALVGAALGGGAASIYEASHR
jgi:hypothetical protein